MLLTVPKNHQTRLPLPLLMARILADDPHDSFSSDDFAFNTYLLD